MAQPTEARFAVSGRSGLNAKADSTTWPGDASVGHVGELKSATIALLQMDSRHIINVTSEHEVVDRKIVRVRHLNERNNASGIGPIT